MGRYLNPQGTDKETWLREFGLFLGEHAPETFNYMNGDEHIATAAVLIMNPGFVACALCFDQRELDAFKNPDDKRLKLWFWIPVQKVSEFQ
jgi:hypothetical protein